MRPSKNISAKIISNIMNDFYKEHRLVTKKRLRNNYKHLKYLWKSHAKTEGKYFKLRQATYVTDEEIGYISDRWQCSYKIQELMAWAGVWKWMILK